MHIVRFTFGILLAAVIAGCGGSGGHSNPPLATSTPVPDATYSFFFSGVSSATPTQPNAIAINGTFAIKDGVVLSGLFDENSDAGPALLEQPITGGTLSTGANGLGQLVLQIGSKSITLALAVPASAAAGKDSAIRIIEFDDTTGSGTRGSGVLKPAMAPATATSAVSGNFASLLAGPSFTGGSTAQLPQALAYAFQTDGAGNIVAGTVDWNRAGSMAAADLTGHTFSATYAVDPTSGRVATDASAILYFIDSTRAFALYADVAASSGSVELQSGSPFTSASFRGNYLGGSLPSGNALTLNEVGLVAADGTGNVSITSDRSTGQGLVSDHLVTGTYSVGSSGRVVVTAAADTTTRIFYMVSPTKVAYLTSDGVGVQGLTYTNGYLGGFEQ